MILLFQHGIPSRGPEALPYHLVTGIAKLCHVGLFDANGKGLDEISVTRDSDVHIGTRLHANIFMLSIGKMSYLFNVDLRTQAHLKTVSVPSDNFSLTGVIRLVDQLVDDQDNQTKARKKFDVVNKEILQYYAIMDAFVKDVKMFLEA